MAHYIPGVLDWEAMVAILDGLFSSADLNPGDRVKTFRGFMRGVVVRLLEDGRVVWKPNESRVELIALPESLLRE